MLWAPSLAMGTFSFEKSQRVLGREACNGGMLHQPSVACDQAISPHVERGGDHKIVFKIPVHILQQQRLAALGITQIGHQGDIEHALNTTPGYSSCGSRIARQQPAPVIGPRLLFGNIKQVFKRDGRNKHGFISTHQLTQKFRTDRSGAHVLRHSRSAHWYRAERPPTARPLRPPRQEGRTARRRPPPAVPHSAPGATHRQCQPHGHREPPPRSPAWASPPVPTPPRRRHPAPPGSPGPPAAAPPCRP